jgi:predicted nucleotidyltransferase
MTEAKQREILGEICQRILETEGEHVQEIILHGSRARGAGSSASDFDVLVVVEDPLENWVERSLRLRSLFYDREDEVDVQVFGHVEFEECRQVRGTLAYPADQTGVRIYARS